MTEKTNFTPITNKDSAQIVTISEESPNGIFQGRRYDCYNNDNGRTCIGASIGVALAISLIAVSAIACYHVPGDLSNNEPNRFFCYLFGTGIGGLITLCAIPCVCSCIALNCTKDQFVIGATGCMDTFFPKITSTEDASDEESAI